MSTYEFACSSCRLAFSVRMNLSAYSMLGAPCCPKCGGKTQRAFLTPQSVSTARKASSTPTTPTGRQSPPLRPSWASKSPAVGFYGKGNRVQISNVRVKGNIDFGELKNVVIKDTIMDGTVNLGPGAEVTTVNLKIKPQPGKGDK